jgi:hypothetical protein
MKMKLFSLLEQNYILFNHITTAEMLCIFQHTPSYNLKLTSFTKFLWDLHNLVGNIWISTNEREWVGKLLIENVLLPVPLLLENVLLPVPL